MRGDLHGKALTAREVEVLGDLAEDVTRKAVASRLGLREQTIKNHLNRTYRKLGVASLVEAYVALGWLRVPGSSQRAGYATAATVEQLQKLREDALAIVAQVDDAITLLRGRTA